MKIYLVGGAVRDKLLGRPVKERDWVVIGSTPEAMTAQGFRPVGKAFPVFLHPKTNEEYALARTEKKVSKGYKGFTFYTDPSITLEEDLARRDLTINAIAEDEDGTLIDPFHGQQHLQQKEFHHVSAAFAEDPVRILRLARFAAKLPDFTVAPKTNQLMQQMVIAGEVDALVAERVWQELYKALHETKPQRFFEILNDCGALSRLFPEIQLSQLPDDLIAFDATQRLALLFNHLSLETIKQLSKKYRVPTIFINIACLSKQLVPLYKNLNQAPAETIYEFIKIGDFIRKPERLETLLPILDYLTHQQHHLLIQRAIQAIQSVDIEQLKTQAQGAALGKAIQAAQIQAITSLVSAP